MMEILDDDFLQMQSVPLCPRMQLRPCLQVRRFLHVRCPLRLPRLTGTRRVGVVETASRPPPSSAVLNISHETRPRPRGHLSGRVGRRFHTTTIEEGMV